MIDLKVISGVVANHLCTECGTCSGICPTDALPMRETAGGQVLPELVESKCIECGLCDMVCPELELPEQFLQSLADPFEGPIRAAYLGSAADDATAHAGQAGGLGRALVAWCLETGRIDGAVIVVDDPAEPLRPKALIATDPGQVRAASRSKYCPIPVNALIMEMMRFEGRLAYVGLSCHMQGLELAMQRVRKLRKKVVLRIGLFCDRVLTYPAADFLARCAGAEQARDIDRFDYRGKEWRGWPGDIRVITRDGREHNTPRAARAGSRALFTPVHCWLCPDKLNVLCDIALGDPHGVVRGRSVPSAVLVRTEAGEEFLKAAQSAGSIRLEAIEADRIVAGQNIRDNTEIAKACGREMSRRGFELPEVLRAGPLKAGGGRTPRWVRIAIWWSIESQTPRGTKLLRRLPVWEPRAWMWFKSGPRKRYRWFKSVLIRVVTTGRLHGTRPAVPD
jgi:coenzyme F420 hydrogenase subunit beta